MSPIEIARSQIGKPWRHQARGPDFWDCIGLVKLCFAAYGIKDRTNYDRSPRGGQLEREIREQFGPPVLRESMQENDVVLMAFPRAIRHVGIVGNHWMGGLSIVHTWAGGPKKVCETRMDDQWLGRIRIVHRWSAD